MSKMLVLFIFNLKNDNKILIYSKKEYKEWLQLHLNNL